MNKVTLFEEYRLIERCENEVNAAWRGAHLLLFFLAFVFGSFCTFCFHMLMYLFDEKCVLFPKLLSLTSLRHNVIYEFNPNNKDAQDLPVDFLSMQWIEKNACTLPTYVPLLSGIFGLVWTTMFLMCSTGSRTLTGLQRPWRVLPPVFLFSVAMGSLCIYSSAVTHYGLVELCHKLGEITGSSTCSYTVNVATLVYERRIRGVYQATQLTIFTAWLHTICWILSAILSIVRVLLAVDFQLIKINVSLHGDIDKVLQRHEEQIRTVSPDPEMLNPNPATSRSSTKVHFQHQKYRNLNKDEPNELHRKSSEILFSHHFGHKSDWSLVPDERTKLAKQTAYQKLPIDQRFIVDIIYDLTDNLDEPNHILRELVYKSSSSSSSSIIDIKPREISTQLGQEKITSNRDNRPLNYSALSIYEPTAMATEIRKMLQKAIDKGVIKTSENVSPALTRKRGDSIMDITDDLKLLLKVIESEKVEKTSEEEDVPKKSSLKSIGTQMSKIGTSKRGRVQILSSTNITKTESFMNIHEDNVDKIDNADNIDKETPNTTRTIKPDIYEIVLTKVDSVVENKNTSDYAIGETEYTGEGTSKERDEDKVSNKEKPVDKHIPNKNKNEEILVSKDNKETKREVGSEDDVVEMDGNKSNVEKETQTKPKEKQD